MKIIDLTHTLYDDMPVFPGDEPPEFYSICTVEEEGFAQKKLIIYSHTGTHIDAPAHMLIQGRSLEEVDVNQFFGKAMVIDCGGGKKDRIELGDLLNYKDKIQKVDFVLFHTGWSKYWGSQSYYEGFPTLTEEAVQWLCSFSVKGIGIDTLSVDELHSQEFSNHYALLKNNIIIIENLTHLGKLPQDNFLFSCLPLKYKNADGSPVRAVAIINQ
ncbi:cyclase family protein [Irregularibacter muris]|uniref:Kynurenine formamidase n=1 Tax=Irregularibacter muris TaxID=1796619 RepID=A0AAE3L026_9FIRM|nr:cyclase family protein [Irregularibacter muris]MCR1899596.1 cyclase family protein [Irregularibacter muris]